MNVLNILIVGWQEASRKIGATENGEIPGFPQENANFPRDPGKIFLAEKQRRKSFTNNKIFEKFKKLETSKIK